MAFIIVIALYCYWVIRGDNGNAVTAIVILLYLGIAMLVNSFKAGFGPDVYGKVIIGVCILIWAAIFAYAYYRSIMHKREQAEYEHSQKKRKIAKETEDEDDHPYSRS